MERQNYNWGMTKNSLWAEFGSEPPIFFGVPKLIIFPSLGKFVYRGGGGGGYAVPRNDTKAEE